MLRAPALLSGLLLATSALASPSRVTDLRAISEGDTVRLLIETDAPPAPAAAIVAAGPRASVQAPGARLAAFEAAPVGGPVRSLKAEGGSLALEFARPVTASKVTPVAQGLLIEVELAPQTAAAPPVRTATATAPAAARPAPLARPRDRAPSRAAADAGTDGQRPSSSTGEPAPSAVRAALARTPQTDGEAAARRLSAAERATQAANIAGDGLTPSACSLAREGVAADAWALDALARHGLCLLRAGDRAGAQQALERIATFEPTHAHANLGLAALDIAAGKPGEAREKLDRALRSRDPWISGRARRLVALTTG